MRALRSLPWLARSTPGAAACRTYTASPSLWVGIQARKAHTQGHGWTGLLACALLHEHVRPKRSKTLGESAMSTNASPELSPMQETTNASPSDLSLREALSELNTVMNELILKMQASTPEMKEVGLVWVLGYVEMLFSYSNSAHTNTVGMKVRHDAHGAAVLLRGALLTIAGNSASKLAVCMRLRRNSWP